MQRYVVGTNRHVRCHPGRKVVTEDLDHLTERLPPLLRMIGDAHHDHLTVLRPHQPVRRDQDLLRDPLVVGQQECHPGIDLQAADDVFEGALQHLDHRGLAPASPVDASHAGNDTVAVPQHAHLARTQKQIVATLVRVHEPEPVGMPDHPPVDQVLMVDHAVATAAVAHHLAVTRHRIDAARQSIDLLRVEQLKRSGKIIEAQRRAVLLHQAENELAAGDRIFVFFGLTGLIGITGAVGAAWFAF